MTTTKVIIVVERNRGGDLLVAALKGALAAIGVSNESIEVVEATSIPITIVTVGQRPPPAANAMPAPPPAPGRSDGIECARQIRAPQWRLVSRP